MRPSLKSTEFGCLFLLSYMVSTMVCITFCAIHKPGVHQQYDLTFREQSVHFHLPYLVLQFTSCPLTNFLEVQNCHQDMVNRIVLMATPGRNATLNIFIVDQCFCNEPPGL